MFSLVTLFLTLLTISQAYSAPLSPHSPRSGCYKYIVIDSPGLVDGTTPNADPGVWTRPTCLGIVNALPGGLYYPTKAPHGTSPGALVAADVAAGELEIQTYMTATLATCPDTKFVLFSYSFGSIAQGIALNNPSLPGYAISAIIYYGNYWWKVDQPGNRGTATKGTSAGDGLFNTPIQYQSITADYCLTGDYLCTGSQGTGANYDAHHKYKNSKWQTDAINFAVNRLKQDGIQQTVVSLIPSPVTSVLGALPTSAVEGPVESLAGVATTSQVRQLETSVVKGVNSVTKGLGGVTTTLGAVTKTTAGVLPTGI